MNPIFLTDAYKVSHKKFETEGTQFIQANFTPRSFRLFPIDIDKCVVFGVQRMVKVLVDNWNENFFNRDKEEVLSEAERIFSKYLGMSREDISHFGDLHDLGYLPIVIKSLPEGSLVKEKVPVLTIENTHESYSWLVTYLETWISTQLWLPMTSATTAYYFRKLVNEWAEKTIGSTVGTEFQLHDFSYRGMGPEEAAVSGSAFLLSSYGTDTIPAIIDLEKYYHADVDKEFVAGSVPATEHSVTCVGIEVNGEMETMHDWITNKYPTGIVSIVSDTLDFWKVITEYASEMKDDILNRQVNELGLAKTVFRPDSGNPVDVLCGTYQLPIKLFDFEQLNEEALKEVSDYFVDEIDEEYSENCGQGYVCHDTAFRLFKNKGKLYKANFQIDTCSQKQDRGDRLYWVDDVRLKNVEETELSPEQKGAVECLWDIFGGTVTEQGYKVLHERVGLIYGDSITYDRAQQIMQRLADKGFASTNCVFGVGSYSMRYVTRDSLGSAVKVTYAKVNDKAYPVSKDPVTDSGVKKSARGYVAVNTDESGDYCLKEYPTKELWAADTGDNLFRVMTDGVVLGDNETLSGIRKKLWG